MSSSRNIRHWGSMAHPHGSPLSCLPSSIRRSPIRSASANFWASSFCTCTHCSETWRFNLIPLIQREAGGIVGRAHRQSNKKNSTGCGKVAGCGKHDVVLSKTRGQLRCPEVPDPRSESVVLILLNRNLDWVTGSKGCGFLFAKIKTAAVITVGNRSLARGFSFQRNLNHALAFLTPMPSADQLG